MLYTVYVSATIDKTVEVEADDPVYAMSIAEDKVCSMLRGTPDVTAVEAYEYTERD